ncbi:MAG: di-trans,poly-cis-decaprenylcistransferase [Deltaproteobacteria bacterium]|nr:di-trans,poly-cis-decaprenylcistransferase [Deltaproteobacteria bacterium]MBI3293178.1 di-trans,poly-cis-decaprenylcistransferase [Deltaproteobacteria bacterium]
MEKTPSHVAIIMDGNGRWAESHGWGRVRGHREGANRVDEIVTECRRIGVRYLSLYAFSTENWNRPAHEVSMLMRLLVQYLRRMDKKLHKNQISLVTQGTTHRLPVYVQNELKRVMKLTRFDEPRMFLNLCLSYGGRQEIVDAAKAIGASVKRGELDPEAVDEATFARHLYQPGFPDPDLLIRTGGESRVSNFLLWQIAYSEIYVTPVLWPDFHTADFGEALATFQSRERRFGLTSAQILNRLSLSGPVRLS